jgi:cytochrome c-type biogenesis protein CcmH/NrfF
LARDLRFNIREQVKSGKESEEILDYLVERYGIKILMKPPLQTSTYILWFAPFVMLLFGAAFIVMFFKQNKKNQ